MEQLELFKIESEGQKAFRQKNSSLKKKRNKRCIINNNTLLDQLQPEIRKVPYIVCKQPKTIKYIPCNWSEEQKEKYKASFYDEDGKFRINPPGDFDVYGGMRTRG